MRIKWNKEICREISLSCKNKSELRKKFPYVYKKIYENNWSDELCSHMNNLIKINGYWNKEKCQEESLKYKTKKEFLKNCSSSFNSAYKNGWLTEICGHMDNKKKPHGYWTKEKCQEEALKYETKIDFQKYSGSASNASFEKGWLNEICSHMKTLKHNKEYWTKEKCHELALKCQSRTEFRKKYDSAHRYSCENNWMNDICSHMKSTNLNNRCIYSYEFSDNHVYIGLTYKLKERHNRHLNDIKSSVNIHPY